MVRVVFWFGDEGVFGDPWNAIGCKQPVVLSHTERLTFLLVAAAVHWQTFTETETSGLIVKKQIIKILKILRLVFTFRFFNSFVEN